MNQERKNIRKAFGYYLPNRVVDQLAKNIKSLQSEEQMVYSICLFTDAEKYTHISETMDPKSLTRLMNQYYEAIFRPIKANGGVVLQVIGDSVLALWTAPQPDLALNDKACTAALAIAEAVAEFNARSPDYRLPTRIGIHAGYILLGNIGAMDHFEYRPVGDIVNTASRLEGLNKYLGTSILASEQAVPHSGKTLMRCLGDFVFIGKSKPIRVFELLTTEDRCNEQQRAICQAFSRAMGSFRRRSWDDAINGFHLAQNLNGPDGPSRFYLDLCRRYRQAPPADGWDGTIYLDHK